MPAELFILCAISMMTIPSYIHGDSIACSNQEYSPLCFCHATTRRTFLTTIFLSKLSLSQCTSSTSYSARQCRQGRFSPSSTDVTQLVPNLVNQSQCLENIHCLQTLRTDQRCRQCRITPSTLLTENTSYIISTSADNLPTDSCFYLCEYDKSCGFFCFDRRVSVTIDCSSCRGRRRNVTCRCMQTKQTSTCSPTIVETTTPRWMQKRGFPAAGILALLVLVTIVFIIAIKLINRRINVLARRKNGSTRRSIATITTYRSRQPSPSTAISFPNTPVMPPTQLPKSSIAAETMVELLNNKSQEFVVDIHRREDEDELSMFLLEKKTKRKPPSKEIVNIVDDDEEEEEEEDRT